jgi:hypothetical protein
VSWRTAPVARSTIHRSAVKRGSVKSATNIGAPAEPGSSASNPVHCAAVITVWYHVPGPAAGHHDHIAHVRGKYGLLLVSGIVVGQMSDARMLRRCAATVEAHVVELEVHPSRRRGLVGRLPRSKRGEQEAAPIRRPRLGLIDTERGADDAHVREMRTAMGRGDEVREHDLPPLATLGEWIRLGSGPHDMTSIGRPVDVVVVIRIAAGAVVARSVARIAAPRQPCDLRAVRAHNVQIGAVPAETRGSIVLGLGAHRAEQDPVTLGTLLGEAVWPCQPSARQASQSRAVQP